MHETVVIDKEQINGVYFTDKKQPDQYRQGSIESALEATGCGKFNWLVTLTGGLVLYAVNNECYSIGYIIPSAECDLNLDLQQKTILVTAGSVGILTTQFFWGWLSDRLGRRSIMLYTLLIGCICTILSVLVPMFWLISLFRFLNGAFVACASGLIFAYVGEFFSDRYRSLFIVITSIFIGAAFTLTPLLAWLIIPMDIQMSFYGYNWASWRIFLLLTGFSAIPACLILYFMPESPKFLAQAQRQDESLTVLRMIHKINNVKGEYPFEKLACGDSIGNASFLRLFNRQYIFKTLLVCILQGAIFATSGGVYLWYPDILQRISKSNGETVCQALYLPKNELINANMDFVYDIRNKTSNDICDGNIDNSVYFQNILIGVCYSIGYIAISFLIRKIGIRKLLMLFLISAGLAFLALYWVTTKVLIDVLFILVLVLSGICVVVVNAAVVDIYPTNLRGMAVCIGMFAGRLGSIISSSVIGYLLMWNCNITFMLYAASLIGCSLLALLLPTK